MEVFFITFRESLEASLVVGIIFSCLPEDKREFLRKFIYIGIIFGVLGSIIGAIGFNVLAGGFSGVSEVIFEGVIMILGASLIVYLVVWISNKSLLSKEIEKKVELSLTLGSGWSLMFLVFVLILREGIETTLFLNTLAYGQENLSILFAFFGILLGLLAGYTVFIGMRGMKLKYMFSISSIFLVLFATGLFARAIREFQEIGFIPTYVEHVWNTNFIVNESSIFGELLKSLFNYSPNPSLMEVLVYLGSMVVMIVIYNRPYVSLGKMK